MPHNSKKQIERILNSAHDEYEKGLIRYAYSKVHNRPTSDDLVQDTFVKTWHYLVKRGEIHIMKAFLYHVLNGLVIDEYRKRKSSSLDTLIENGYEPVFDKTDEITNIIDGKGAMLLIEKLPEKYKTVISMRYIKLLTLTEISLITGEAKNTIAVQIHRGLQRLRILYHRIPKITSK